MSKKRVRLLHTIVKGRPGEKIRAFGHQFEIQPDGSCVAEIDEDFIDAEVDAGRYEIIEDAYDETDRPEAVLVSKKNEEPIVVEVNPLGKFNNEKNNFFGCSSAENLRKELKELKLKKDVRLFAEKKLGLELPERMGKERMISEIITTTESAIRHVEQQKDSRLPQDTTEI